MLSEGGGGVGAAAGGRLEIAVDLIRSEADTQIIRNVPRRPCRIQQPDTLTVVVDAQSR